MNIKKLPGILFMFLLLNLSFASYAAPLTSDPEPATLTKESAAQLMVRLHEIKALAKTDLSASQKTELRKEVKDIRKQLKSSSNGVYLSIGAIVIILLILILLLR